ncbi:MAG: hypothetical protein WAP47_07620 [Candidatus Rokuibacteriota bacterium]
MLAGAAVAGKRNAALAEVEMHMPHIAIGHHEHRLVAVQPAHDFGLAPARRVEIDRHAVAMEGRPDGTGDHRARPAGRDDAPAAEFRLQSIEHGAGRRRQA